MTQRSMEAVGGRDSETGPFRHHRHAVRPVWSGVSVDPCHPFLALVADGWPVATETHDNRRPFHTVRYRHDRSAESIRALEAKIEAERKVKKKPASRPSKR